MQISSMISLLSWKYMYSAVEETPTSSAILRIVAPS